MQSNEKTLDDKKAATVLLGLIGKYALKGEEKEAVKMAVGVLSWTSLAGSRIKKLKDKRDRDAKWQV